jgi:hypothetical protein
VCESGGGGSSVVATSGAATSGAALQLQPLPLEQQTAGLAAADSSRSSLQEMTYDSFDSMHTALRNRNFCIRHKRFVVRGGAVTNELRTVHWGCIPCNTNFVAYTSDGEEFVVAPPDHRDNCTRKPHAKTGPAGATVISHYYELAAHQGLPQFIEELGASSKQLVGVYTQPMQHKCTAAIITHHHNRQFCGCTPTDPTTNNFISLLFTDVIRADQIADHVRVHFPGVTVVKELLGRLARKGYEKMFGKGVSDVLLLRELAPEWEERGGSFSLVYGRDLGKSGTDEDKMIGIIWIAPFAHLLVQAYGDLFGTDGTHGISHYGWRAMPFYTMNSLDNPHPVMVVMATSENADIMCYGIRLLHRHLAARAVDYPLFAGEVSPESAAPPSPHDPLHEDYICPPEWRPFVHAVIQNAAHPGSVDDVQMPSLNAAAEPPLLVDGGTGLDLFARRFALPKVECKLHLDSHNHIPAGELK